MKLPKQTTPVERKTYSAAAEGAGASFSWGSLIPVATSIAGALL